MEHHFNVEFASKHGVNESIFCHNLYFWIVKNRANKRHFHKGRYWTYNSNKAFRELFPYWTEKQMRTVIDNCVKKNLILKDNFNEDFRDQTLWYSLTDLALEIYEGKCNRPNGQMEENSVVSTNRPNGQMELPKRANGIAEKGECHYTDSKHTDNKHTDINLVNKDVNKNQEIIDKLILEYMKKGLSKELALRLLSEINFDEVKNLEGYLRGCLENVLHKSKLKRGLVETEIKGLPLYDWLT